MGTDETSLAESGNLLGSFKDAEEGRKEGRKNGSKRGGKKAGEKGSATDSGSHPDEGESGEAITVMEFDSATNTEDGVDAAMEMDVTMGDVELSY